MGTAGIFLHLILTDTLAGVFYNGTSFIIPKRFFTFIWPLKVIKTLFTYFDHQIKSLTSLNCNMTLIQFVFPRGDYALCYYT